MKLFWFLMLFIFIFENYGLNVKFNSNEKNGEKNNGITFRKSTFRLTTTSFTKLTYNHPIEYSTFQAGKPYIFKGSVHCGNGWKIGNNASVSLIEVDEYSFDDIVFTTNLEIKDNENEGKFSFYVAPDFSDFPTDDLEFKLHFKNCCGDLYVRSCGFLINGTRISYTLHPIRHLKEFVPFFFK